MIHSYYYKFLRKKFYMKRGPKPRLITEEFLAKGQHLAARGLSQQQVCYALGFSETWWYDAKQKNSDISESFKRGQAKGLAEVSNAIYEQALNGSTGAACFFLKNRDPDRWSDVKSVNAVQINVGKMTDTQLLEELRSDPRVYAAITRQMPELKKSLQLSKKTYLIFLQDVWKYPTSAFFLILLSLFLLLPKA